MAKTKKNIPKYKTVIMHGTEYFRTRITDSDGKRVALYAKTAEELYEKVLELSFDADGFGLFKNISDEDAEKALWIAAILEVLNDVPVRRMNHIFHQRNMKYDWEQFLNKYYEE
mgnify:CR=1 FL=1